MANNSSSKQVAADLLQAIESQEWDIDIDAFS